MSAPGIDPTAARATGLTPGSGIDPTEVHPASVVPTGVEVIRSEERLVAGVERLVAGTVRIGKRVVTEERTVTVTVRREELFFEQIPADAGVGTAQRADLSSYRPRGTEPVVTFTLSEEEPQVSVRVVPRERVRLYVDRITGDETVTGSVAREVVEADVDGRPLTER